MSPWVIIQSTLNPSCCGQCKNVQAYVHQNCIFQLVYQVLDIVTRCRLMATNALLNWQPGCEQCKKVHAYTHQQCIAQLVMPGLVRCDKVQAYAPPTNALHNWLSHIVGNVERCRPMTNKKCAAQLGHIRISSPVVTSSTSGDVYRLGIKTYLKKHNPE